LNACGYDEGLAESDPIRQKVRNEVAQALTASEEARDARDNVCLYIAQHRMTGTVKDVSQYVSLALYLTPWPALETSVELPEMPPDSNAGGGVCAAAESLCEGSGSERDLADEPAFL